MGRGTGEGLTFETVQERGALAVVADPSSISELVQVELESAYNEAKLRLAQLEADRDDVARTSNPAGLFKFKVSIKSAWASSGEKHTETTTFGTLKEAFLAAVAAHKETNSRSDVQGYFSVTVELPNGTSLPIPEASYQDLYRFAIYPGDTIATARKAVIELLDGGEATLAEVQQAVLAAVSPADLELIDPATEIDGLISRQAIGWTETNTLALAEKGGAALQAAQDSPSEDIALHRYLTV